MSFETLKQTILQEAQSKAEGVLADLQAQTKREETRIMNRAKSMEEEIIRQAENEAVRRAHRVRQEAELAGRAAVLVAKQVELDATKLAVQKELLELDSKQTHNLLKSLLELTPNQGTIIAGEHHVSILKKLVKGDLRLENETVADEGGFVFRSANTEINLTISHLVSQLFNRYRAEIAQELFS